MKDNFNPYLWLPIILLILCILMLLREGDKVEAADWKQVTIGECKGCVGAYIYKNGMLRKEWEDVYEKQRGDYETRTESTVDEIVEAIDQDTYKRIFDYVPADWEIELLKRTITAECGYTEPDAGVERVLCVIANRCRRYRKSVYAVITSPGQFETWSNGKIQSVNPSGQAERITERVLRDGSLSDREVLYFTAGYYNPYCRPGYRIGNHYFGY